MSQLASPPYQKKSKDKHEEFICPAHADPVVVLVVLARRNFLRTRRHMCARTRPDRA